MPNGLIQLESDIIACQQCPRLRDHCRYIAQVKRRAYQDDQYWAQPVPGFGDPRARLFILGLAPGAHGANRTGRVFTGDRSGDWLYRALHQTGFANQPTSTHRYDGLTLNDCWVSASVRCAPPDNKPTPAEVLVCRSWLERELQLMPQIRVVVALGRLAFDNYLTLRGLPRAAFHFAHNQPHDAGLTLISSYHPSQQNTSTGKLTEPMLKAVFDRAREILHS